MGNDKTTIYFTTKILQIDGIINVISTTITTLYKEINFQIPLKQKN